MYLGNMSITVSVHRVCKLRQRASGSSHVHYRYERYDKTSAAVPPGNTVQLTILFFLSSLTVEQAIANVGYTRRNLFTSKKLVPRVNIHRMRFEVLRAKEMDKFGDVWFSCLTFLHLRCARVI